MKQTIKYLVYAIVFASFSGAQAGDKEDYFHAVSLDNYRSVEGLLERGFDANVVNDKGQSGLLLAIRDDSPKVFEVLAKQPGLKVDSANGANETPLMMAALKGRLDWMRTLMDRGAPVNRAGWTPLHYAASGPEPKAVALLLDKGADIEAPSPNRTTPLMMAARYGAIDSAELLLTRGASLKAKNDAGLTAVDFARTAGRDRLVTKMEQGAR